MFLKKFALTMALFASSLFGLAVPGVAQQPNIGQYDELRGLKGERMVPSEFIVKFKPGVSKDAIGRINQANGTAALSVSRRGGFMRLRVTAHKSIDEMVDIYSKNPNVEYAEPNFVVEALLAPNDPYFTYQWHLNNAVSGSIHMQSAWDVTTGDPSVIVAIVDTGVAYENYGNYVKAPDLANTAFVAGYDFVNNDTHPNDDHSHGTHVAGTIAQSTNNDLGAAGVAFHTAIMPVKVLGRNGSGSTANVANGIYFAADHGAKVINMSLGSTSPSVTLENALAYAYNRGVTIACAAGNGYQSGNSPSYPAAYDAYCIAVGATRFDETRSYYSNTGGYLDVVAPGGDTSVDQNGDGYGDGVLQQTFNPTSKNPADFGYWFFQGTSMATPHVAGVAALLIAEGITEPTQVREALQTTAKDLGLSGWDQQYGWGLINAAAALNYGPVAVHDVAITDITAPATAVEGDTVSVVVTAANPGDFDEGFDVVLSDDTDGVPIGTRSVSVAAKGTANLNFSWNTASSTQGSHNLIARATSASDENPSNDTQSTAVTVEEPVHDVAVIALEAPVAATIGDAVDISVTVENLGTYSETTDVSLTDDGAAIGAPQSVTLAAGDFTVVHFVWDTTGGATGDHTLNAAAAPVVGETDTADNAMTATVTLSEQPSVTVHVAAIDMGRVMRSAGKKNQFYSATAAVTITDLGDKPVEGVSVAGEWSSAVSGTVAGLTDASGTVVFTSSEIKNPSNGTTFTFTVTGASKAGVTYEPGGNVVSSNSISVP